MIKTGLTGLAAGIVICLVVSCENNIKDVQDISSRGAQIIVDKSYHVEITYSDSAVVQTRLVTPEAYHFKTNDPYYEMKKGIVATFYDANQKERGRVTSDYAIWKEYSGIVDLKKNVVVTNVKGETVKSDQIIWDRAKKKFYSDKMVTLTIPNANGVPTILYGDGFSSDEDLKYPNLIHARGNVTVSGNTGF